MKAPYTAQAIFLLVQRLTEYATDPREDVRRGAEQRLEKALEALVGAEWSTVEQMATVFLIRDAAEHGKDAVAVVAQDPRLAGHEEKIRAAIAGCAGGDRIWPPMLDLLNAAGLAGGITDPKNLKRKWRQYEAGGVPEFFQPPGCKPPAP